MHRHTHAHAHAHTHTRAHIPSPQWSVTFFAAVAPRSTAIPAFGWLLLLQRWQRQSTATFGIVVVAPWSKNKPAGILLVVLLVVAEKAVDNPSNDDYHRE